MPGLRLVLIDWEDSVQPVPGWSWLKDGCWETVVRCRSVGWLVHDGATVKAVAPNKGEHCGETQVAGVIRIPVRSITRLVYLAEPALEPARIDLDNRYTVTQIAQHGDVYDADA